MPLVSVLASASAPAEPPPAWLALPAATARPSHADLDALAPEPAQREAWIEQGEGYVELLWRARIRIAASGQVESRAEVVRHFLTEVGVQRAGNIELSADASRDRLRIEAAYATAPGSAPRPVAPETIQVVDDVEPDIFSDLRRVIVPYAGLAPGSSAVMIASRTVHIDDWPLPWSRLILLGSSAPIARHEISIVREPGAPPITWATDDPELRCEERSSRELFCQRDAVPAIREDPDVASYFDLIPHLFVGVETSWEGLRRRVGDLVRNNASADAALRRHVAALLEGADTPEERFGRLHRFVADDVRYVALSHGSWAVVPRPAPVTFERRFGDCKDKVTLLVAMAELAGLRVVPVLTSSERYRPDRLLRAGSAYFDHMIACAELGNGPPVCVDPTVSHAGPLLPAQLGGAVALELAGDGPARVTVLPQGDFGLEIASRRTLRLGCDGFAREVSERAFSGPASLYMRSQLVALRADDLQRWASDEYRLAVSSDLQPDFAFEGLSQPEAPIRVRYQTDEPGRHDPRAGLHLDVDPWLVSYARSLISQNRHHLHRMIGLRYVAEDTWERCGGAIDFAGPALRLEGRFGKLTREVTRRAGKVIASTTVEIPAAGIPAGEIAEFNRFVENAVQQSSVWLAWERQGD